jgi:hypothetical protein
MITKYGVPQPEIVANFTAYAPLAFVDQYIGNLKEYCAIAIDVYGRAACASIPRK